MSVFDKTICDCCVCPMQCVLKALERQEVELFTRSEGFIGVTISRVEDFIVFTEEGGKFAICNITAVSIAPSAFTPFPLKPIQTNNKGLCACCEEPMTNVARSRMREGQPFDIEFISSPEAVPAPGVLIQQVGEGIVFGLVVENTPMFFSTCAMTRISPSNSSSNTNFITRFKELKSK
ncbi:hypothetical protein [Chengkuizengella axinellae]|uniref:Uncharacterized protein n=1 Tax=Chengkuizengella axinellae TaxID=3064388 RepID=A0ABT9J3Q7_9BACL|nr:hypothetical protein [Chengkuizengella sp. 2205SS18-9]MDP5276256.1 hypothetical protein [Chengkuizengella sp. 2205SS18-9]